MFSLQILSNLAMKDIKKKKAFPDLSETKQT